MAPAPAYAAQDQTTFTVSATVIAACAVSASNLSFGNYNPTSATPTDSQTTLNVTCTNGVGYSIGMNAGAGTGATVAARKMTQAAYTLNYTLYGDSGRNTVWGNTLGVDVLTSTATGALQTFTVYGRVPAGQTAPGGAYSDTITVTVTY